jgi:hypothetical protein
MVIDLLPSAVRRLNRMPPIIIFVLLCVLLVVSILQMCTTTVCIGAGRPVAQQARVRGPPCTTLCAPPLVPRTIAATTKLFLSGNRALHHSSTLDSLVGPLAHPINKCSGRLYSEARTYHETSRLQEQRRHNK